MVAKPTSHKYLTGWLDAYPKLNGREVVDSKGVRHVYEWMNKVPLRDGKDAIEVNYFHYQMIKKDKKGKEKITYQNSWVTDLEVTEATVKVLVRGGRCKWKIENECFNTLKNQGYCLEHNYGHGEKHLCFNFYLLTLIAFSFHQVFELTDKALCANVSETLLANHTSSSSNVYFQQLGIFTKFYAQSRRLYFWCVTGTQLGAM